jgi:hypothetical protein
MQHVYSSPLPSSVKKGPVGSRPKAVCTPSAGGAARAAPGPAAAPLPIAGRLLAGPPPPPPAPAPAPTPCCLFFRQPRRHPRLWPSAQPPASAAPSPSPPSTTTPAFSTPPPLSFAATHLLSPPSFPPRCLSRAGLHAASRARSGARPGEPPAPGVARMCSRRRAAASSSRASAADWSATATWHMRWSGTAAHPAVAVQAAFEKTNFEKPGFHSIGAKVETRRFRAMCQADSITCTPPPGRHRHLPPPQQRGRALERHPPLPLPRRRGRVVHCAASGAGYVARRLGGAGTRAAAAAVVGRWWDGALSMT